MRLRAEMEEILSRHTGQSVDQLRADTDRDLVLSAEEAVAYGLADGVLDSRKLLLGNKPDRSAGLPGMSQLVDRTIAALRANHDTLVTLAPGLSQEALDRPERGLGVDRRPCALAPAAAVPDRSAGDRRGRRGHARARAAEPGDLGARSRTPRDPVDQVAGFIGAHAPGYVEAVDGR